METICFITDRLNKIKVKPNLELALWFYKKHILETNAEVEPLLTKYEFPLSGGAGGIPTWKWELFAAILVGDTKKKGYGIDLTGHEVKTYQWKRPPEYQYHKNSWEDKLGQDKGAKHVCIWYKDSPSNLEVYLTNGNDVDSVFESWRPKIYAAYEGEITKDRCRMHLPKNSILNKGKRILELLDGCIASKDETFFFKQKISKHAETEIPND
jgi:hypothetical protein